MSALGRLINLTMPIPVKSLLEAKAQRLYSIDIHPPHMHDLFFLCPDYLFIILPTDLAIVLHVAHWRSALRLSCCARVTPYANAVLSKATAVGAP